MADEAGTNPWLGAAEIARAIADRRLTSRGVVEAAIARIERVNPVLNALVVPTYAEAREAADRADARVALGGPLAPLHGVPVTIKEQFAVTGTPATLGVARQNIDSDEGPLVQRLRGAGAIVLGKTNVPQLLIYNETDNPVYGRTNNPWDLARSSGGSSGGEAALIAAGGSPLGLGSDIGGSLRTPSHACGIVALKPTTGRLSNQDARGSGFALGQTAILSQAGPMARTVEDCALAMRVLVDPADGRDASVAPVPWRDPADVNLRGLRIGVYDDDGYFQSAPALRRAVAQAILALTACGAEVKPFAPPEVRKAMAIYFGLLSADGARDARRRLGGAPRDPRVTALLRIAGLPGFIRAPLVAIARLSGQRYIGDQLAHIKGRSADGYWRLVAAQESYRRTFLADMDRGGFDALVCPPHALPALSHGSSSLLATSGSYAMLYNLLGMPAGVVPVTRVGAAEEHARRSPLDLAERLATSVEHGSAGLPVGVQIVARHWREDIVLALMAAIERECAVAGTAPGHPPETSKTTE